ncbi:MAG: class I SAM-dependent methyltransferase, partial [candidate division WOR-3 bacterium]
KILRMEEYYKKVGEYYSEDAKDFDKRYEENFVLKRLRRDFREITLKFLKGEPKRILEIGFGTGLDLEFFAKEFKDAEIWGIEVAEGMLKEAQKRLKGIKNVKLFLGSLETLEITTSFDLIYSYFGAVNTVYDLEGFCKRLSKISHKDTVLVFSCVNKFYLFDIFFNLLRLRFKKAFERIKGWKGYSPYKDIDSKPLSYWDVKRYFRDWEVAFYKGYSIAYPAWYRAYRFKEERVEFLWEIDKILNNTPFKYFGEYSIYVLRRI